jgi:hypothetical protein
MGLSTHVLDTMHGTPAAGMTVELHTTQGDQATLVKRFILNADGRNPDGMLFDHASLQDAWCRAARAAVFEQSEHRLRRCRRHRPLPRAAAGQPVELLHLSRELAVEQVFPAARIPLQT